MFDLRSLIWDYGESWTNVPGMNSEPETMSYQTCSIESLVDLQPFGCNLKGRLFDPLPGSGVRRDVGVSDGLIG